MARTYATLGSDGILEASQRPPNLDNPMSAEDDIIVGGSVTGGVATPARLGKGSDGQVLTVDPTTHHLVWANSASGFADPTTTKGDLIVHGASTTRLGIGADGSVLTAASGETLGVKWANPFTTYDALISAMSGLVHRWKFEDASGDFADSVGSLTLVKSGAVTYAVAGGPVSGVAGSIQFGAGGVGKTSGVGSIPTGANARAFVLVFKGPGTTAKQALLNYGASGSTRQWWTAFLNETVGAGSLALDTWADDAQWTNAPAFASVWHFAVFQYDGSLGLTVHLDGTTYGRALGGALNTGSSDFWIGRDAFGTDQLGAAIFDDLAVFNRALHGYEMAQLHAALAGSLP